jgi:glycosyltransferase involved in cell wall biosynthesis
MAGGGAVVKPSIKILHVITRLDLGGSAENTLLTAIGFAQRGYRVDILAGNSDNPPSDNEKKALENGVSIIRMKQIRRNPSVVSDVIALFLIYRYLRAGRYDLVHTHTSKAGILGRIAAKLANTRCIVHTPHGHIFYGYFSRMLTDVFVHLERFASTFTDAQITLTHQEKRDYLARNVGRADMLYPVYSGIHLGPFLSPKCTPLEARAKLGLGNSWFVAGTVARYVPVKNHHLIISAASRLKEHKDIHFAFAGDGELQGDLVAHVKECGLQDRFHFMGWRNDVPEILVACDIFIMCSKNEGMGRAFVEAQAAGLPVIGTKVGGVAEVLDEGRTGYLVGPDDADGLADKIELLYSRKSHRNALSEACRKWVNPKFSVDVMIDEIEKVYTKVLEEKRH